MLKVYSAAASEPVSLAQAKDHLRITADDDDVTLTLMIKAARLAAEAQTRRCLLTSTWDYYLDAWPGDEILLPIPPLQSVTSVKYYDTAAVLQTVSSSDYHVDAVSEPARIWLADGKTWPELQAQRPNAIVIRFVAGYTDDNAVPQSIRQWILLHVGAQYENRELVGSQNFAQQFAVLPYADGLLDPYRLVEFV